MTARAAMLVLVLAAACSRPAKEAEAEVTYLGQMLACVDRHELATAIEACRSGVRQRWGIAETVRDGGAR